jgi:hypothetical protein
MESYQTSSFSSSQCTQSLNPARRATILVLNDIWDWMIDPELSALRAAKLCQ